MDLIKIDRSYRPAYSAIFSPNLLDFLLQLAGNITNRVNTGQWAELMSGLVFDVYGSKFH